MEIDYVTRASTGKSENKKSAQRYHPFLGYDLCSHAYAME